MYRGTSPRFGSSCIVSNLVLRCRRHLRGPPPDQPEDELLELIVKVREGVLLRDEWKALCTSRILGYPTTLYLDRAGIIQFKHERGERLRGGVPVAATHSAGPQPL